MIAAVDTSVLMAIFKGEPSSSEWFSLVLGLRRESEIVACDVVWAEVAPLFRNEEQLRVGMQRLGVSFSPLSVRTTFAAGQLFTAYRKGGGARTRMIPDFMIAAHAMQQAEALLTADSDFGRQFAKIKILRP